MLGNCLKDYLEIFRAKQKIISHEINFYFT